MSKIQEAITHALKTFKLVIAVDIGSKVLILNPRILESLSIDDIAIALSASDLEDTDIIKAIKVMDEARQPPFKDNKKQ